MRDSYERLFLDLNISKEQFFEFGLKETIYAPFEKAEEHWQILKGNIENNSEVYIRGFGRDAAGTKMFFDFYKSLINNSNIKKDGSNNDKPTRLIQALTGYSKTKNSKCEPIRNYQVSHIFGRTKNVYTFTAPWNIAYIPKMHDPFTGHEAKGDMIEEYTKLFQEQSYKKFQPLIEDFNKIITDASFVARINDSIETISNSKDYTDGNIKKLIKAIKQDFTPIQI